VLPQKGIGSCSCCAYVFEPKLFKKGRECKSAALAPLTYIWSSVVECARWAGKMRYQHFAFAPDDPNLGCRICDIGVEDADPALFGAANPSFNIYTADISGRCDVNSFSPTGSSSSSTCTCQGIWPSCACSSNQCTCSMAVAGGNKVQDGCTCDASFWGMPNGTKPGVWHCNYGYTCPSAGCDCNTGCVSCAIATYKNWTGVNACMACPIQATTLSEASTFSTQCLCNKGYTGPNGQVCNACVAGKYKPTLGNAACLDCPLGKYSPGAGSVGCLACPGNSYSPASSSALTQCTCNVGFTGPNGGSCTACAAGTYKNATGSATCTGCSGNSHSPVSSTRLTQCTCNVGFFGPDGGSCTAFDSPVGLPRSDAFSPIHPANGPSTGGAQIFINGAGNFGLPSTPAAEARVGGTACRATLWISESSLLATLAPAGVGLQESVTLTMVGVRISTWTKAFTYDSPEFINLSQQSSPAKAVGSVTFVGTGFGAYMSSPTLRLGDTACVNTRWTSSSTILCKVPSGSRPSDLFGFCYTCVLVLLYIAVLILLYIRPRTAIYASLYCYICVFTLLYMCPHAAIYVSSYCPIFASSHQLRCHDNPLSVLPIMLIVMQASVEDVF
jgi:hypothetical protein